MKLVTWYETAAAGFVVGYSDGTAMHALSKPRRTRDEAEKLALEWRDDLRIGLVPRYEIQPPSAQAQTAAPTGSST